MQENMAEEENESLDALEYELNQMGLSVEDLQPPEDGHFDRRAMARVESARIMSRRFIERDRVKDRISTQTKVRYHRRARYIVAVVHEVTIVAERESNCSPCAKRVLSASMRILLVRAESFVTVVRFTADD